MSNTSSEPNVVLITGASSGIGRELARLFFARGDTVILAARRGERLEELKAELESSVRHAAQKGLPDTTGSSSIPDAPGRTGEVMTIVTDLTIHQSVEQLIPRTLARCQRLDILINNAGYGLQCEFEYMGHDEIDHMFQVNVLAPMNLASQAVKVMRKQGSGCIVNVASVGGLVAHPLNVAYCASKHALVGFSKSLRLELAGTGIRVVTVCPASTKTEFFDVALSDIPFDKNIDRFAAPASRVARVIVNATQRNQSVVFPTLGARFLYLADKWLTGLSAYGNIRYRDRVMKARSDDAEDG